uniref:Uncharacterized protein n=1 Tax=virus sp. ctReX5 TaxID=2825818 RepID=A0A8S5RKZ3_9VIRU|nr:MAG TPA: hypothetical protein [virus sp. ctReX5]DAS07439.1 MAG TPA: hypothetical protein [Caudoviricetes sp.]DAT34492.1 MAG TPA: hypothetical protein [Caudoviricetes sp.]DAU18661.1 MAG TPA: hypothetical protein [Caudoviricetes sp.]
MYEKKNFKAEILYRLWLFDFRSISFCIFPWIIGGIRN